MRQQLRLALSGCWLAVIAGLAFAICVSSTARADARSDEWKPGDIVALSLPCWACDLIEKTTGEPYSHVAVVDRDGGDGGKLVAWMAAEPAVMKVDLAFLLSKARRPIRHLRLAANLSRRRVVESALARIRAYEGVPYDPRYEAGDGKLYCSELLHYAFRDPATGASLFPLSPMNFEPYLAEWRATLGEEPPQGKPGISPAAIATSARLRQL